MVGVMISNNSKLGILAFKVLYLVKSTTKCKQGAARVDLPGTTPAKRAPFWPPRPRDGALVVDLVRYRALVIISVWRSVSS